jgi:8-oxo-dGTP diphosphatase
MEPSLSVYTVGIMSQLPLIFGSRPTALPMTERPGSYAIVFHPRKRRMAVMKIGERLYLPGGGREANESPEACLHREVREETGWCVNIHSLLGQAGDILVARDHHSALLKMGHFYTASFTQWVAPVQETSHTLLWLSPEQALQSLVHHSHRWAVEQAYKEPYDSNF